MKTELSSVDVMHVCRELSETLEGARFDKAYQIGEKTLLLRFHKSGRGKIELVITPSYLCTTLYKRQTPDRPGSYAMQLRKNLSGLFVRELRQEGFERIVRIVFSDGKSLLAELFSRGNNFLLDDSDKILGLMEWQKWRDRVLGVGKKYAFPPAKADPRTLTAGQVEEIIRDSDRKIAACLVSEAGLPGDYAEDACLKAGVEKKRNAKELSREEVGRVARAFMDEIESFTRIRPALIMDSAGEPAYPVPHILEAHEGAIKEYPSFNEALDEFFSTQYFENATQEKEDLISGERQRIETILSEQEQGLERMEKSMVEDKARGDKIYENMEELQELIDAVAKARKKGLDDGEISKALDNEKKKGTLGARLFVKLEKYSLTVELPE